VPRLEFLERLPAAYDEERWLVRAEGAVAPQVAWILSLEDTDFARQFVDESRIWIGFAHARVSRVFGMTWLGNRLVVAVDDDRGPTLASASAHLADRPVERERWTVAQLIAISRGLASMDRYIDERFRAPRRTPATPEQGFVYRALEPDKLFVDVTGHAKLRSPIVERVDRTPRPGMMGGFTPNRAHITYMSPEQCRGKRLTAASDVFALAGNLVFALTGKRPFSSQTDFGLLQAILEQPMPPIATLTPGLDGVLARAFAKAPADRYATPRDFADALEEVVPDAYEYDGAISDLLVEWWPTARPAVGPGGSLLGDRCPRAWNELTQTGGDDIRHCASCDQDVVRVDSLAAVLPLVGKRCMAYKPG
jgi:serine/threonine protein kinase